MVGCDILYLDLPQHVRRLVDGIDAPPPRCGHCRQSDAPLRCSRCKCVNYCNIECQHGHFRLHKKNCKQIDLIRKQVNESWQSLVPIEEIDRLDSDSMNQLRKAHLTMNTTIRFADLLMQIGYRESDTVANGLLYYREALKHYLLPILWMDWNVFIEKYHWVEDRTLLMIVVLGGDESCMKEWFTKTRKYRNGVDCHEDRLTVKALLLLIRLKLFKAHEGDNIPNQIKALLASLERQKNFLAHLKNTIPLKPWHVQTLFSAKIHDEGIFSGIYAAQDATMPAPPELWMIYQDCFFEYDLVNLLPEIKFLLDDDAENSHNYVD